MKYIYKLNDARADELLSTLIDNSIEYEIGSQSGSDITINCPEVLYFIADEADRGIEVERGTFLADSFRFPDLITRKSTKGKVVHLTLCAHD